MSTWEEGDDLQKKVLCHHCVGDEYLNAEMQQKGKRRKCSYCKKMAKSYLIAEMASRVEIAFEEHYTRTSDQLTYLQQMLISDKESNYEWEREGEQSVVAIMNAADMPEMAAKDIQRVLDEQYGDFDSEGMGEETEFSNEACYKEKETSDVSWQSEWREFENSLKTEARFFSQSQADTLAGIFKNIDQMRTREGLPVVVDAGPGTDFNMVYRARVFQSDDKLKSALCQPDKYIGPPPPQFASAGRMNAHGISVFYGASDEVTAIAEVRPPVGSQVAVACFEIIRPLRLLNLTAMSAVVSVGSIFDPEFGPQLEREMFLRSLSQRITQPVRPDDEALEYLVTQAVTDYLATEGTVSLDGILFPSVQAAGRVMNVVLFHRAAQVETIKVPSETEISADTGHMEEDGWVTEYRVNEEVRSTTAEPVERKEKRGLLDFDGLTMGLSESAYLDLRQPALRIVADSVHVHVIRGVQFETERHSVLRYRWNKPELISDF